jgi:hypothetical protein
MTCPALLTWPCTPDAQRFEHIMIIETDYVFIAAPNLTPLPAPGHAMSFPFGYIVPTWRGPPPGIALW